MQHDPLNDAMTAIRNAENTGKRKCIVKPSSKLIGRVLKVMLENNYISEFEYIEDGRGGVFQVTLNGNINDCGIIKPRFSSKRKEFEKYEARYLPAQDFGVLILSTTSGVMSHVKAKNLGIGGRLLAYVF